MRPLGEGRKPRLITLGEPMDKNNQYLLNPKKKKSAAHIWTGSDTACRMYSTGGMVKRKQEVVSQPLGKPICQMCINSLGSPK